MTEEKILPDHKIILEIVNNGSSVLDLGCGEGDLMILLEKEKQAKVQGIEIDEQMIYLCVEKGLNVFHEDIDNSLRDYADNSFDYVIINQSFQQVKKPDYVLTECLRIGREVIVGFPNFAHIRARFQLFFKGRAPLTRSLPYQWFNSPNFHFFSINDFKIYCSRRCIKIEQEYYLGRKGATTLFPNLFAYNSIFVITNGGDKHENIQ